MGILIFLAILPFSIIGLSILFSFSCLLAGKARDSLVWVYDNGSAAFTGVLSAVVIYCVVMGVMY
ncbi:MAG: hypothetical protein V3R25_05920 [Nitrosomonadaceae bacterium]